MLPTTKIQMLWSGKNKDQLASVLTSVTCIDLFVYLLVCLFVFLIQPHFGEDNVHQDDDADGGELVVDVTVMSCANRIKWDISSGASEMRQQSECEDNDN